jgi:hypothetical protein
MAKGNYDEAQYAHENLVKLGVEIECPIREKCYEKKIYGTNFKEGFLCGYFTGLRIRSSNPTDKYDIKNRTKTLCDWYFSNDPTLSPPEL